MIRITSRTTVLAGLAVILVLAFAFPVMADKPPWAGNKGNNSKNYQKDSAKQKKTGYASSPNPKNHVDRAAVFFTDKQREVISRYYRNEFRHGNCPPGLAKKNNGCMPPGQAKKWRIGHPLPRDIVYYDLPAAVVVNLGRPPEGYRYIRIASDILLMAVGTAMIVDAIEDLNSL